MSGDGNTNANLGGFDMKSWTDQLRTAIHTPRPLEPSLIDSVVNGFPREIFDLIMNELTLDEQAKLALSSDELNRYIRPVMDGFVWSNPPLDLPRMMSDGLMTWHYVKLAEEAASATGHVACPWCSAIHSPLRCLETPPGPEVDYWTFYNQGDRGRTGGSRPRGYMCSRVPRPDGMPAGVNQSIPFAWHPLMLYAFGRWSSLGMNTAQLRGAGGLDFFSEELSANSAVPMERHQWNLNWVPGYGLFARARHSQLFIEADNLVAGPDSLCLCEQCNLTFDSGGLNEGNLSAETASIWYINGGPAQAPVISANAWVSGGLYAGPRLGCPNCPVDFQFAWEAFENDRSRELYGECHWVHVTTWIHIGGIDIRAKYRMMKSLVTDDWLLFHPVGYGNSSLGQGERARLSGMS